jgi:hypothetical protein
MPNSASAAKVMMNEESNQSFELPSSRKMVRLPRPSAMSAMPSQSALTSIDLLRLFLVQAPRYRRSAAGQAPS